MKFPVAPAQGFFFGIGFVTAVGVASGAVAFVGLKVVPWIHGKLYRNKAAAA